MSFLRRPARRALAPRVPRRARGRDLHVVRSPGRSRAPRRHRPLRRRARAREGAAAAAAVARSRRRERRSREPPGATSSGTPTRTTGLAGSVEGLPVDDDVGRRLAAHGDPRRGGPRRRLDATRRVLRLRRARCGRSCAMPLCDGQLPNKAYDTRTLAMVGLRQPAGAERDRLVGARRRPASSSRCAIVTWRHPELTPLVRARGVALATRRAERRGRAASARRGGRTASSRRHQEGRFGYEQYAAQGAPAVGRARRGAPSTTVPTSRSPKSSGGAVAARRSPSRAITAARTPPCCPSPGSSTRSSTASTRRRSRIARALLRVQERRSASDREAHRDLRGRARPPAVVRVLGGAERRRAVDRVRAGRHTRRRRTSGSRRRRPWRGACCSTGSYPDRLLSAARELVDARGLYAGRYDRDGDGEPGAVAQHERDRPGGARVPCARSVAAARGARCVGGAAMSARVLAAALAAALAIAPRGAAGDGGPGTPATDAKPPPAGSSLGPATEPADSPAEEEARPEDPELEAARIAWRYFERNYHPATGLVNSVDGYPNTTMWDLGSTVFATLAARELGLVDGGHLRHAHRHAALDARDAAALPGRAAEQGVRRARPAGWRTTRTSPPQRASASRPSTSPAWRRPSRILAERAPRAPRRGRAGPRALALLPAPRRRRAPRRDRRRRRAGCSVVQEGRLGYEQYAAQSFARLGFGMSRARGYDHFAAETQILGVPVRHDSRDRRRFGAVNALVTDPWVLGAFELGRRRREAARSCSGSSRCRSARWERTGVADRRGRGPRGRGAVVRVRRDRGGRRALASRHDHRGGRRPGSARSRRRRRSRSRRSSPATRTPACSAAPSRRRAIPTAAGTRGSTSAAA